MFIYSVWLEEITYNHLFEEATFVVLLMGNSFYSLYYSLGWLPCYSQVLDATVSTGGVANQYLKGTGSIPSLFQILNLLISLPQ